MGYIFNELIPPAILLDHPGITKEEFADLLDQTHTGDGSPESSWDDIPEHEHGRYYSGLDNLASVLYWRELLKEWWWDRDPSKYDFSKTEGDFNIIVARNKYFWYMREGRYYLDPKTFDNLSASLQSGWNQLCKLAVKLGLPHTGGPGSEKIDYSFGYTDLVITAEAIKNSAWKLLTYRGLKYAEDFLRDFPQSAERMDRAIWDATTSVVAKDEGLNHTEFLRMRLLANI